MRTVPDRSFMVRCSDRSSDLFPTGTSASRFKGVVIVEADEPLALEWKVSSKVKFGT